MTEIIVLILTIITPIAFLFFATFFFRNANEQNNSLVKTCGDIFKFSDNLEDSLRDIAVFDRQSEELIIRGELTCANINDAGNQDDIARKLNWYAHTRYYYFTEAGKEVDYMVGTTEDWLRRQLKSSIGE